MVLLFLTTTCKITIPIKMLTATNHTLEKLENLLKSAGYRVRYEKGNFKTGACLLQSSKIVVVNKFSNLESKIQSVAELARMLEMDHQLLDDKQLAFLQQIKQTELQL
jgi:non-homologous end joining protein Ku